MGNIYFHEEAWEDYLYWQTQDKKTLRKINELIRDMLRNTYSGIGKPEALKNALHGYWSRRIDEKNRIVYCQKDDGIYIISCRGHYGE